MALIIMPGQLWLATIY